MSDEVKKKNSYPDIRSLDRQVTSVQRTVKSAHKILNYSSPDFKTTQTNQVRKLLHYNNDSQLLKVVLQSQHAMLHLEKVSFAWFPHCSTCTSRRIRHIPCSIIHISLDFSQP
jgi:hypothetical protein